jgi:CRP-like cAMP-binding protein
LSPFENISDFQLVSFLADSDRFQANVIFDGLLGNEFQNLIQSGLISTYRKGETIFKEANSPAGIYYVKHGLVKKFKSSPTGGEQIFYIGTSGELLGYHSVLSEKPYSDSASALVETELIFIPKELFMKALRNSPELTLRLLKFVSQEFSIFKSMITMLATRPVKERLAISLLMLDSKFKKNGDQSGKITLSRTDLANIVGTAKETLVRVLRELKLNAFIQITEKAIRIINRNEIIREAIQGQPAHRKKRSAR